MARRRAHAGDVRARPPVLRRHAASARRAGRRCCPRTGRRPPAQWCPAVATRPESAADNGLLAHGRGNQHTRRGVGLRLRLAVAHSDDNHAVVRLFRNLVVCLVAQRLPVHLMRCLPGGNNEFPTRRDAPNRFQRRLNRLARLDNRDHAITLETAGQCVEVSLPARRKLAVRNALHQAEHRAVGQKVLQVLRRRAVSGVQIQHCARLIPCERQILQRELR